MRAGTAAQRAKPLSAAPAFHMSARSRPGCSSSLPALCSCAWEKQPRMAQGLGPLLATSETQAEAPGSSLAQLRELRPHGVKPVDGRFPLSLQR